MGGYEGVGLVLMQSVFYFRISFIDKINEIHVERLIQGNVVEIKQKRLATHTPLG